LLQTLCGVKSKFPNVQTDGIELKNFVLKVNKTNNPKSMKVDSSIRNERIESWQEREIENSSLFSGERSGHHRL
jgi:hypothetical protein